MKNPTINVGMLILMVPNVEEAVAFYQKIGLPLRFHLKNQWAEMAIGTVRIGLCPTSEAIPEHHTGIVLETDDVNNCYEIMRNQGVEFVKEPFAAVHGIMASFKDTGNNVIDLYQPTPEKVHELAEKVKSGESTECCKTDGSNDCNNC